VWTRMEGIRRRNLIVLAFWFSIATPPLIAQQSRITRLDGSNITAAEIDATISRLVKAAEGALVSGAQKTARLRQG
jgi:hypothetical protein